MRKETKFLVRNVDGSVYKTASALFSSGWDGKTHSIGYLVAGTDMNKERDSGKLLDYINRDRKVVQGKNMTKKNIKDDKKEDEKNIKNDKKEDDYHVFLNKDCFYSDEARRYWSKMCSFHRGYDKRHVCGNPNKCQERLRQAEMTEGNHRNFLKRWS